MMAVRTNVIRTIGRGWRARGKPEESPHSATAAIAFPCPFTNSPSPTTRTDFCGWQKQEPTLGQSNQTGAKHVDPTLVASEEGQVARAVPGRRRTGRA